jgi:hypothetical protein
MFLQYIPDWDVLNLSVLRDGTNAWELDSTRFYLRDFFNHSPKFTSVPDTLATTGEIYNYEIIVADPDPFDTISITAESIPEWLSFVDNGNGSATLSGTPDQAGNFEVVLKASDGLSDTIQEFIIDAITVNISEANNSNILIYPTIFSDKIFVEIDKEAELNIYSSTGKHIKQIHLNDDRNEIDLSAAPSGIYYCVVIPVGKNQITYKIIKY